MCVCVCTLAYAQRRQAAVGDRLSYQLYLRERCTQTSTPSTHAHVSAYSHEGGSEVTRRGASRTGRFPAV